MRPKDCRYCGQRIVMVPVYGHWKAVDAEPVPTGAAGGVVVKRQPTAVVDVRDIAHPPDTMHRYHPCSALVAAEWDNPAQLSELVSGYVARRRKVRWSA